MSEIEYVGLQEGVEYVKIYGLQRSGTNYLTYLVNENFENTQVLVNLGGWKHGTYSAPWELGQEVHVLAVVKDPYAWLVSVYKYWGPERKLRIGPDLRGVSFHDFVRNRCYFERQNGVPYLFRASNPVQHWNNMNFHWTTILMNEKKLFVLNYESLLARKEKCLEMIGTTFGLTRKSQEIIDCDTILEPADEKTKPTNRPWTSKEYFLNQGYLDFYTPETLEFVNEQLDLDLMVGFNYDYVLPEDLAERSK
jgi:hypothetical protein